MRKLPQNKVTFLSEVQRMNEMVTKFLNRDLADRKMSTKNYQPRTSCLSFRYRVSRLNGKIKVTDQSPETFPKPRSYLKEVYSDKA